MLGEGGSVARARAAKVSMIRLTHSSWTAVNTEVSVLLETAETNVKTTAVMLTVTWNCPELDDEPLRSSIRAKPEGIS